MKNAVRPWRIIDSTYLHRDKWLTLRADTCETEDGVRIAPYYVQETHDWVHIIALNDENGVLINEQYRHGTQQVCMELPGGGVEPGETPLVAAQRELLEETGCRARQWIELPASFPNPAGLTNVVHPFLALGVEQVKHQELDPGEEISCSFIPASQLFELIRTGEFRQAMQIGSLMVAFERAGFLRMTSPSGA